MPVPTSSDRSDRPAPAAPGSKPLPSTGSSRRLRALQATAIISDATLSFCARFLEKPSRFAEQLVQAAQSARDDVSEYDQNGAHSAVAALRLVISARARLDELLLDYEDFLRQRGLGQWKKDDPEARAVRAVQRGQSPAGANAAAGDAAAAKRIYAKWIVNADPAVVANTVLCLVHQVNFLLDQEIRDLERLRETERANLESRDTARRTAEAEPPPSPNPAPAPVPGPACPVCGRPMVLRTAKKGARVGGRFWGCSGYPLCKCTRRLPEDPGRPDSVEGSR